MKLPDDRIREIEAAAREPIAEAIATMEANMEEQGGECGSDSKNINEDWRPCKEWCGFCDNRNARNELRAILDGKGEVMSEPNTKNEWMREALQLREELKVQREMTLDLADELKKAEAANERLRNAECGKCGRSLAPDGDCHGCRADRLEARVGALREWAKPSVQDPTVYGAKNGINTGYALAKKDARDILNGEVE